MAKMAADLNQDHRRSLLLIRIYIAERGAKLLLLEAGAEAIGLQVFEKQSGWAGREGGGVEKESEKGKGGRGDEWWRGGGTDGEGEKGKKGGQEWTV